MVQYAVKIVAKFLIDPSRVYIGFPGPWICPDGANHNWPGSLISDFIEQTVQHRAETFGRKGEVFDHDYLRFPPTITFHKAIASQAIGLSRSKLRVHRHRNRIGGSGP